eukprot:6229216-Prymnesium_polylepis.1
MRTLRDVRGAGWESGLTRVCVATRAALDCGRHVVLEGLRRTLGGGVAVGRRGDDQVAEGLRAIMGGGHT